MTSSSAPSGGGTRTTACLSPSTRTTPRCRPCAARSTGPGTSCQCEATRCSARRRGGGWGGSGRTGPTSVRRRGSGTCPCHASFVHTSFNRTHAFLRLSLLSLSLCRLCLVSLSQSHHLTISSHTNPPPSPSVFSAPSPCPSPLLSLSPSLFLLPRFLIREKVLTKIESLPDLENTLQKMDSNGDGFLTVEEVGAGLADNGIQVRRDMERWREKEMEREMGRRGETES